MITFEERCILDCHPPKLAQIDGVWVISTFDLKKNEYVDVNEYENVETARKDFKRYKQNYQDLLK